MSDLRVFKRYEKKYLLTKEQYEGLLADASDMFIDDEYPEGLICNIYYDTPNYRLIRESIDKPVYKEKLRLRAYNTITKDDKVYLEIKKKSEGIVYKRREKLNVVEAEKFVLSPGDPDTQIGRELAWMIKYYGDLKPAMYISYKRHARKLKSNKSIRVTFDYDIKYREDRLSLLGGSDGEDLFKNGEVLMEIKTSGNLPLDFIRVLEKYGIYPHSFSKYGTAYKLTHKGRSEE